MKNFPIIDKETGREYWVSRSVAVVGLVFTLDNDGNIYVLATRRGIGTPDPEYVGTWCLPCGYVDFDETTEEAIAREIYEETGVKFKNDERFITLWTLNSDPKSDKRQNITLRYVIHSMLTTDELSEQFTTEHSEKNEVSDIKLIKLSEIDNYEWAFNHKELIKQYLHDEDMD